MAASVKDELSSIGETLKEIGKDIVDFHVSFLDCEFMQDYHVSMLVKLGEESKTGLESYLIKQAELEKELVKDLTTYYNDKMALEKKYRIIVTSRSDPQFMGSNKIADALSECINKIEDVRLVFIKKWRNDPTVFNGKINPRKGPNRIGVEGALWALELIASTIVIPLLCKLVDHATKIEVQDIPHSYRSVFNSAHKSLRIIQE